MEENRSEMKHLILERITPQKAYITDGSSIITVQLNEIQGCSIGDVLIKTDCGYTTDKTMTEKRSKELAELKSSLMI